MSMFQEVKGVCMGFQRGAGGFEFRALTAWGEKLLSSLVERALMLRNRLPDGRSWKRLWEGWVGFFTILVALLEHRARKMSRMEGRGALMIFAAVFTVRWRVLWSAAQQFPYQTVMQQVMRYYSCQYPATSHSHWRGVDQHSTGHNQQPDQLPQYSKTAHFVVFYCGRPKAQLCINHAVLICHTCEMDGLSRKRRSAH